MKGRGTVVFYGDQGGALTGTLEIVGGWVHFLRDAKGHEQQECVQAVSYNYQAVYSISWDADSGPFRVAAPVSIARKDAA